MKDKRINPNDPLKKWIAEAGKESPGEEFHLSVLKKIEALPQSSLSYQPVISPLGWRLIFGLIGLIFGWSVVAVPARPETPSLFDKLPTIKLPLPNLSLHEISIPTLDFSPQFLMGINAFFILGFIMIIGTIRNKRFGI